MLLLRLDRGIGPGSVFQGRFELAALEQPHLIILFVCLNVAIPAVSHCRARLHAAYGDCSCRCYCFRCLQWEYLNCQVAAWQIGVAKAVQADKLSVAE